jgi:hypothetical protein
LFSNSPPTYHYRSLERHKKKKEGEEEEEEEGREEGGEEDTGEEKERKRDLFNTNPVRNGGRKGGRTS